MDLLEVLNRTGLEWVELPTTANQKRYGVELFRGFLDVFCREGTDGADVVSYVAEWSGHHSQKDIIGDALLAVTRVVKNGERGRN